MLATHRAAAVEATLAGPPNLTITGASSCSLKAVTFATGPNFPEYARDREVDSKIPKFAGAVERVNRKLIVDIDTHHTRPKYPPLALSRSSDLYVRGHKIAFEVGFTCATGIGDKKNVQPHLQSLWA